ncbi:MAG: hypothetical protein IKX26_03445 [Bacteroidales bacterium]|nr:hypothetical protein [Bacteroidales bacterium]MBR5400004.1 hypothetical protein [Bacteroidales bacterium]MBR6465076.1 hypothetical protein [Bacteroidales bacterium]
MKKFLLLTTLLLVALAASAQTYYKPRQSSNKAAIQVVQVERTANSTIVTLKYTAPNEKYVSQIVAYPTLTDDATGKKFKATDAMNFQWNTRYKGNVTYVIKFPALPKTTTSVTFKEADREENPFIIKNIALPTRN